jgi:hypothetical protein
MPCIYDDDGESDRQQRAELDKLTRMLCTVLGSLEELDQDKAFGKGWLWDRVIGTKEIEDWWKKHKEKDRKREEENKRRAEEQKKKQDALSKLSKAERKLLGL